MFDKYYRLSLIHLIKSFKYALDGIHFAIIHNQNLRIAFLAGIILVVFSIILKITPFEMGIVGVMTLLVICAEMINTAIEKMVDLITKEHRQEAKIAKDVSAGMVLLTVIGSLIVGILIFVPHILKIFR